MVTGDNCKANQTIFRVWRDRLLPRRSWLCKVRKIMMGSYFAMLSWLAIDYCIFTQGTSGSFRSFSPASASLPGPSKRCETGASSPHGAFERIKLAVEVMPLAIRIAPSTVQVQTYCDLSNHEERELPSAKKCEASTRLANVSNNFNARRDTLTSHIQCYTIGKGV